VTESERLPLVGLVMAGLLAGVLTPMLRRAALARGWLDRPSGLKIHREAMPTMGGLAIVAAVLVTLAALDGVGGGLGRPTTLALAIAALPVVAVSARDDLVSCSVTARLAGHAAAGLVLYAFGLRVTQLTNPIGPTIELGLAAPLVTVLWVMTAINAMNLIDGLDGLAAGVGALAALSLACVGIVRGEHDVSVLALALVGATAGFLPYNFPRARVYLGDVGSTFIGLALGATALLENRKATAALTLLLPLIALGVPVLDTLLAVVRRAARGRSPLRGDLGHLHHRLLDLGLAPTRAVACLLAVTAAFGLLAVLLAAADKQTVLSTLLLLAMLVGAALLGLDRLERARNRHPGLPARAPR
jgi:UDP-GlcNAc:undecaprenyl-phosphate GlcNAc-1-phosphate transferase